MKKRNKFQNQSTTKYSHSSRWKHNKHLVVFEHINHVDHQPSDTFNGASSASLLKLDHQCFAAAQVYANLNQSQPQEIIHI